MSKYTNGTDSRYVPIEPVPVDGHISARELIGLPPPSVEYLRLPLAVAMSKTLPPAVRLWLVLRFAYCVHGPDLDGGWVRLGSALYTRAGLDDRYVRRRAVRAFEQMEGCEVRRGQGRVTLIRFAEHSDHREGRRVSY